ncbi:MAG: hypothetical protein ISR41_00965 [Puniceicoccaceae bacterium]|nr:hypothetical protein [Puniceicoccaceae bacterium]
MLRKTVTNEGSCYKVVHGAEGSFFSTNGPTNINKVGEVALPTHLCVVALGSCMGTETDKNIRFNC